MLILNKLQLFYATYVARMNSFYTFTSCKQRQRSQSVKRNKMKKNEIKEYIKEATPYAEAIEDFVWENGVVGLGFLVKILAENMDENGASKEWFIDNLIEELKKDYDL